MITNDLLLGCADADADVTPSDAIADAVNPDTEPKDKDVGMPELLLLLDTLPYSPPECLPTLP